MTRFGNDHELGFAFLLAWQLKGIWLRAWRWCEDCDTNYIGITNHQTESNVEEKIKQDLLPMLCMSWWLWVNFADQACQDR